MRACYLILLSTVIFYSFFTITRSSDNDQTFDKNPEVRKLRNGKKMSKSKWNSKLARMERKSKMKSKTARLTSFLNTMPNDIPSEFIPAPWSRPHTPNVKYVIFAAAMGVLLMASDVKNFAGTARKIGFDGDIVLAMVPGSRDAVVSAFKQYEAVVYNVSLTCRGEGYSETCVMFDMKRGFSINVIRYHLYRWWASLYEPETLIMVADFRDVFFQSNPFLYRPQEWAPPASQLVVFQEAHPNAVISRCPFNGGWIKNCYGQPAFDKVAHNTVICSGVSMGTRDAILVYAYMMTRQTDPKVRLGKNATDSDNYRCVSAGMDQGFHNWMVYSGMLDKYMDVRIFQQGEGPVNTVGGFYGENKRLKFTLEEWGILKGTPPNAYIANWNGDKSPVIHQLDRFLGPNSKTKLTYAGKGYGKLGVMHSTPEPTP